MKRTDFFKARGRLIKCSEKKKNRLLWDLEQLRHEPDRAKAFTAADNLLLEFINDQNVTAFYRDIKERV